jgi:hypothetical protein
MMNESQIILDTFFLDSFLLDAAVLSCQSHELEFL